MSKDAAARLRDLLSSHAEGIHRLGEPAPVLDSALPAALAAVYRCFDGGELFHETLVIKPAGDVARVDGRYLVGEALGDDLQVDASGHLWILEKDSGEIIEEGSAFDRWLLGYVEAESELYDSDGEFLDDLYDEAGELTAERCVGRERKILKRDKQAPAPRWRLARALVRVGKIEEARRELEEVVAARPGFAWAWFDLARASERLGQVAGAVAEAEAAADADPDCEYAGYFLAHAARLAAASGASPRRAELAARARERAPGLVELHLAAARQCRADDDPSGTREHAELVLALVPGHLEGLDLARQAD